MAKPKKFVDGEARITVKCDPKLHQAVTKQAEEQGTTVSEVVRRLLFGWIAKKDQPK